MLFHNQLESIFHKPKYQMNEEGKEKIIAYNIELKKQQYFHLLKKAQKKRKNKL